MIDISTSTKFTAFIASSTLEDSFLVRMSFFWDSLPSLPAAAYVLIGVIISGVFTTFSDKRNIKNRIDLKDIENKHSKELKDIETKHQEKLQQMKEVADKNIRLLDSKIKVFSDFHNSFSEVLVSGTNLQRQEKIEVLRKDAYKVRLLVPSIRNDLDTLDEKLMEFTNFYFDIINNGKTFSTPKEKEDKISEHLDNIQPLIDKVFAVLGDNL